MDEWTVVIGRSGQIKGLLARADLNGSVCKIQGFAFDKQRYCVKCIDGGPEVLIKPENLIFGDIVDDSGVESQHPTMHFGPDSLLRQQYTPGSVVSLGDGSSLNFPQILVGQHCRIRGDKPHCRVFAMTVVNVKSGMRTEFENIKFVSTLVHAVFVVEGTVLFRNCSFTADDAPFAAAKGSVVYLDSCIFENCRGSGVICNGSKVIMQNCIVRNTGGCGVEVRDGGTLIATKCQIIDPRRVGVSGYKKALSIELTECFIMRSGDSAVLVVEGCSGTIRKCLIDGAKVAGVAVERRGRILVEQSVIKSCLHGILAQTGKCNAVVQNCQIKKCKMYGVFIGIDCRGQVALLSTTVMKNGVRDVNNDASESYCEVLRDGIRLGTNGLVATANPVLQALATEKAFEFAESKRHFTETTNTLKARAKVGLCDIVCNGCGAVQERGTKFNACSQCLQARYCSKECQRRHWKSEHKRVCVKQVKYEALLHPGQSI